MKKIQKILLCVFAGVLSITIIVIITVKDINNKEKLSNSSNTTKEGTNKTEEYEYIPQLAGEGNPEKYEVEVVGISKELQSKIPNTRELYSKIREYMYKDGLIEATKAEAKTYNYNEAKEELKIRFDLDDPKKTHLIVTLDTINNEYTFLKYN